MTFRPSDGVLSEADNIQQTTFSLNQYDALNQGNGNILDNSENLNNGTIENDANIVDAPLEEIKAPDLSELLKNHESVTVSENGTEASSDGNFDNNISEEDDNVADVDNSKNVLGENIKDDANGGDVNDKVNDDVNVDNILDNNSQEEKSQDDEALMSRDALINTDKMPDAARAAIVSEIEGSVSSNLDYLVDYDWLNIVKKYKKINRLFFRWGIYIFALVAGVFCGIVSQMKFGNASNIEMVENSLVENKNKWIENTSDKILSPLIDSGVEINVMVPYGSASFDSDSFQSKSNLVSYGGMILPQLASIDYNSNNLISLEDFEAKKTNRDDIKDLINSLIIKNSIYRKTTNLDNVLDTRWVGKTFEGSLIDGFSLGCISSDKLSDFVCNKFLESFYKNGKYYDLSLYSSDVLILVKELKKQGKDINPICNMVNSYVLRAGVVSDNLGMVMDNCNEEDRSFYKKMVSFIDLENSLGQPELSDKVYDDPDLNAYKLLSAQQSVYKILEGTSLNENYIKSYLSFVQTLINKDKGNHRYISPIYEDMIYVFNTDEISQKLMQKGKLSADLKMQIDQINNGNSLYGYLSLLSLLTTPDIIQKNSDFTGIDVKERTIDDIFSQYYAMTNRLKIRKVIPISEDQIKVQTEFFDDKILSFTDGKSLKLTVVLSKYDNILYVDSIKVANQSKLSDILNIYNSDGGVSFNDMLNYIGEQVGMWYERDSDKKVVYQSDFCETIQGRDDISVYSCDDESLLIYKGETEYNFALVNGVLDSFVISDETLNSLLQDKLAGVMFTKENTPTIVSSIIDFSIEKEDDTLEKKLEIVDQFRIHFKLVPDDIRLVESDPNEFLIDFTLGEFKLQAHYNMETHLLYKISYANCSRNLEIKGLTLSITTENEPQLIEILNNPKAFFTKFSSSIYKKYEKLCGKAS